MSSISYELKPMDSLFFRGMLPMEAGRGCSHSLFPPTPESVIGAFRTKIMIDNGISAEDFRNGRHTIPELGSYGKHDQAFRILGIFLRKGERIFTSAPASLFITEEGKAVLAAPRKEAMTGLGIASSCPRVPLAPPSRSKDSKPLTGAWIDVRMLQDPERRIMESIIMPEDVPKALFCRELHTGIALSRKTRSAEEHMLYSSSHIRLMDDVSIIIELSSDIPINAEGLIKLGGEQKICSYRKVSMTEMHSSSSVYVSAVPIAIDDESRKHMVATAKPVLIGGWDLARHFYKRSLLYYPAGAVFDCDMKGRALPWKTEEAI